MAKHKKKSAQKSAQKFEHYQAFSSIDKQHNIKFHNINHLIYQPAVPQHALQLSHSPKLNINRVLTINIIINHNHHKPEFYKCKTCIKERLGIENIPGDRGCSSLLIPCIAKRSSSRSSSVPLLQLAKIQFRIIPNITKTKLHFVVPLCKPTVCLVQQAFQIKICTMSQPKQ